MNIITNIYSRVLVGFFISLFFLSFFAQTDSQGIDGRVSQVGRDSTAASFASGNAVFTDAGGSVVAIDSILDIILIALIVIVMIVFVWQIILYIKARWSGGGGVELAPVLYSAIVLAILVGVWGIANFLFKATGTEDQGDDTFNLPAVTRGTSTRAPQAPQAPQQQWHLR